MDWEMQVICPNCNTESSHHDNCVNSDMTVTISCDCGYSFKIKFVCDPVPYYMDELGYITNKKVKNYYIQG
jgi:transcription elongation factor Elf1